MKILHIIQRYPPAIGGSEAWCRGICGYLADKGHCITVLTLDAYNEEEYWRAPSADACRLKIRGTDYDGKVRVIRCKITRMHPLVLKFFKILERLFKVYLYGPHSVEMYFRMMKEIKENDVVHLHTVPYTYNFIGLCIARLFKKRVVITPHFHIGHHQYEAWSVFWLLKMCDKVLAVSDYEKNYLSKKGIDRDRIIIAHNAVSIDDYAPKKLDSFKENLLKTYGIQESAKIIIFVGRKIEYKGVDVLIEAIRTLRNEMPVKLFLVGPDFPWFKIYYSNLTAEEKRDIINFGCVSHSVKVNLLHLSDVLVLPSAFEAFGIVLLEAWACNLPVIGSDRGALREIIDKGGSIFKHGDIKSLNNRIRILLGDEGLSKKMAQWGKEAVSRIYSLNKTGEKVAGAYYEDFTGSA